MTDPNSTSHLLWRLRNNDTAKHLCGLAADRIEALGNQLAAWDAQCFAAGLEIKELRTAAKRDAARIARLEAVVRDAIAHLEADEVAGALVVLECERPHA